MLHEFLAEHRDAIIERARVKVAARRVPVPSPEELVNGVPLFLSQLTGLLRDEQRDAPAEPVRTTDARAEETLGGAADQQGGNLLRAGLTIAQVVEGYGDVCQAITEHAADLGASITTDEYRTLNLCLDVATARAVTAFSRARDRSIDEQGAERLGTLAHELRNVLSRAVLSYQALKRGAVGIDGSTGALLGRSLQDLGNLIDRSLAEVRLAATLYSPERVLLAAFIEEVEIGAALEARRRRQLLSVPSVGERVAVTVDRQLLASAVSNLLQNAAKFTPEGGRISLFARIESGRVLIDVGDECGGIPDGDLEALFRPFQRHGSDRSGLGLGLKITRDAVSANGGELRVRNLPGKGCVFTIELPASE